MLSSLTYRLKTVKGVFHETESFAKIEKSSVWAIKYRKIFCAWKKKKQKQNKQTLVSNCKGRWVMNNKRRTTHACLVLLGVLPHESWLHKVFIFFKTARGLDFMHTLLSVFRYVNPHFLGDGSLFASIDRTKHRQRPKSKTFEERSWKRRILRTF